MGQRINICCLSEMTAAATRLLAAVKNSAGHNEIEGDVRKDANYLIMQQKPSLTI